MGKRKQAGDDEPVRDAESGTTSSTAPSGSTSATSRRRTGFTPAFEMGDAYYRNLYKAEPDFQQLAKQDADFAAALKRNSQLDFSDPKSVMQLTKTLLKLDFGLEMDLPDDRLCPPVPNRHNYILWLKALMDSSAYDEPGRRLSGLDIGTGAGCIYPLLGCAQRPWYFVGTDIDYKNLSYARKNVALNNLQSRIKILARDPSDALIPLDDLGIDSIDFVMTNPPFYLSDAELLALAAKKSRPPHSSCTGAPVEMVCVGGEVGFVGRMLAESLVLRERVQWYTTMLGKAGSVETVVERLKGEGVDNYAVTEFVQGNKTRRWAVGWSFGSMRPSQQAARGLKGLLWKRLLPAGVEVDVLTSTVGKGITLISEKIQELGQSLELTTWEWDREKLMGIGRARENVWSRAWRRKKMREAPDPGAESAHSPADDAVCAFGFQILIRVGAEVVTGIRWIEGHDHVLFESFCAFVRGKLKGT